MDALLFFIDRENHITTVSRELHDVHNTGF